MEPTPSVILLLFFIVGCLTALKWLWLTVSLLYRHLMRPCCTKSMYQRYGRQDAWALVTGGTDGIGLEMCQQLAAQGFNIVMVSRNADKIKARLEKDIPSSVKSLALPIDLGTVVTIQEYRDKLEPVIRDLDIAVVCLNAGSMAAGPIDCQTDKEIEIVFNLNGLHVVYMAKALLQKLMSREGGRRSALIVTSSGLAKIPMPGIQTYCVTKIMVSRFCQSLAEEVRDKNVDVMAWECGPVQTKLNPNKGMLNVPVGKAVAQAFNKVGLESLTYGPLSFELSQAPMQYVTPFIPLFARAVVKKTREIHEKVPDFPGVRVPEVK